jgi:hypothetical protein
MTPNNRLQRTALRAAADAARSEAKPVGKILALVDPDEAR